MSVTVEQREDEWAVATAAARLVFRWDRDRWEHRLESVLTPGGHTFARSVETPSDSGPERAGPSPTYQEIQVSEAPGAVLVMALGRHGRTHFATTFRVSEEEGASGPGSRIEVDVAARSGASPAPLAATYTIAVPVSW